MKRATQISLLALVTLASLLVWLTNTTPEAVQVADIEAPQRHQVASERSSAPAVRPQPSRVRSTPARQTSASLQVGDQRTWSVTTTRNFTLEAQHISSVETEVSAQWTATLVEREDDLQHVKIELEKIRIAMGNGGKDQLTPAQKTNFIAELERPFYLTLERTGRISALHFLPSVSPFSRGVLKDLAGSTQIVGLDPKAQRWESEESDSVGDYLAKYIRRDGGQVEKSRKRYLRMATSGEEGVEEPMATIVSSHALFSTQPCGWLRDLKARDISTMDFHLGIQSIMVDNATTFTFHSVNRDPRAAEEWRRAWAHLETVAMSEPPKSTDSSKRHAEKMLDGATYEDVLALAASLKIEGGNLRPIADVHRKAKALFRVHPESAIRMPDAILALENSRAKGALLGALSDAGTPQSQAALRTLLESGGLSHGDQLKAIDALGFVRSPNPESVALLTESIDDLDPEIAESATLSLGTAVNTLRKESNLSETDEPIAKLIELYESAETVPDQVLALRALGNTGDPRVLPIAQQALASPIAPVRGAGVAALRFIPGQTADALIDKTLIGDLIAGVRRDAVAAASYRDLVLHQPVFASVLAEDSAPTVRTDVVATLGLQLSKHPDGAALLAWTAENDPDETIRDRALAYLTPTQVPGEQ